MGGLAAPGEAVVALEEAIDVIRALWDADEPRRRPVDGDHYRLAGAARGPAPVHEVGDLARRLQAADARPGGPQGRRLAAEPALPAARRPGRGQRPDRPGGPFGGARPLEIRRLLNVGAATRTPEELARHALEDGIDTFIVDGRRPRRDRALAGEVAPAVRELVAAARRRIRARRARRRAGGRPRRPRRGDRVRAPRRHADGRRRTAASAGAPGTRRRGRTAPPPARR